MAVPKSDFNPNSYPDVPLYNIQAVSASTGVPSITLRSWERRYGIPAPKRDPKGYRLYSERDLVLTQWLTERVHEGVGISRAVNMLRVLEKGELLPPSPSDFDFAALRLRLINAIQRMDETGVKQTLSEALTVASVEDMALHLLQPALYEIGDLWAGGRLSPTVEHFGSNLIRGYLGQLAGLSSPPLRAGQILVGSVPGELHDIGASMLALFLRRRGFDVAFVVANLEADSLAADVRRLRPPAVCLSVSRQELVRQLVSTYREINGQYEGLLTFGGRVFNDKPELIDKVPGIFLGADAAAASRELERRLGFSP